MDEYTSVSQLDDFEVIAERVRVTEAIAALTDRYRQLNQEMTRRETLRWMVPITPFTRLSAQAARMLAVETLLAEPEALCDDVLESCLYLLRERLRGV